MSVAGSGCYSFSVDECPGAGADAETERMGRMSCTSPLKTVRGRRHSRVYGYVTPSRSEKRSMRVVEERIVGDKRQEKSRQQKIGTRVWAR